MTGLVDEMGEVTRFIDVDHTSNAHNIIIFHIIIFCTIIFFMVMLLLEEWVQVE